MKNKPSKAQWEAMGEAERIAVVRGGRAGLFQIQEGFKKGSEELRAACKDAVTGFIDKDTRAKFMEIGKVLELFQRAKEDLQVKLEEAFELLQSLKENLRVKLGIEGELSWLALLDALQVVLDIDDEAEWDEPFAALIHELESDSAYAFIERLGQELKRSHRQRQQEPKRKEPRPTPPKFMPQQTWPEARNMAIALADGPSGRGWQDIVGEIALRHVREDDPIQIKLIAGPSIDWWGMPATYELLRDELREAGVDAALLLNEVLYLALEHPGQMFSLDSLIEAIGWDPRSASEKNECRRWVWRKVSLFENMLATGQRRWLYSHPDTKKKVPVAIVDRLVILGPRLMPEQKAFDNSEPPFEISFKPGEHLEQYRGNRKVLTDYGNVRRIAEIPAKQASGKWARGIGLTLNQFWRQSSKAALITHVTDGGKTNRQSAVFRPFTRRELLTEYYIADPHVEDILNGPNPKRAREYWDGAVKHLKLKGVIGSYKSKAPIRDGDKSAWLDQPLDIRPANEGLRDTIEIAKAQARIKRSPSKAANKK